MTGSGGRTHNLYVAPTCEIDPGAEAILMPAKPPHAVYGQEQFKMLPVVVF